MFRGGAPRHRPPRNHVTDVKHASDAVSLARPPLACQRSRAIARAHTSSPLRLFPNARAKETMPSATLQAFAPPCAAPAPLASAFSGKSLATPRAARRSRRSTATSHVVYAVLQSGPTPQPPTPAQAQRSPIVRTAFSFFERFGQPIPKQNGQETQDRHGRNANKPRQDLAPWQKSYDRNDSENAPHRVGNGLANPERRTRVSTSFVTAAVRTIGPAVVRIDTERSIGGGGSLSGISPGALGDLPPGLEGLLDDPGLKKFFAEEYGARILPPKRRLERGLGSGFIISEDGIIVTNSHVIKGADKVTVTLTDGRTYNGRVTGTDDLLDLAVIKIDDSSLSPTTPRALRNRPLPVAKLGVSADISVGDWCIAVGNPHGLNNTVTLGIVSSLNRSAAEVGIPEKRLSLIQTSASLNAGNSGGPITNEYGEVIGVATAVRANAEGIGFAIPIDRVKNIVEELASGKTIAHPFVGVKMVTLTPDFARQNNSDPNAPAVIPEVDGAIIMHVIPQSPAAKPLGLRRYDIIVGIDGKPCRTVKDVQAIVEKSSVGQRINVQVIRGGDKANPIDIMIETGDMSKIDSPPRAPQMIPIPLPDPRM